MIDERCAGFVALGIAKATGRPVAVTCTSGSAAANLMPAVVEAHEARVPLIVLTADRPPELRDTGAGQAIDQLKLYGSFAKWFVEVGNHEPSTRGGDALPRARVPGVAYGGGGRPGVVHLNFPLREPLAPVSRSRCRQLRRAPGRRPVGAGARPSPAAGAALVEGMAARVSAVSRGVIVCGPAARRSPSRWPRSRPPLDGPCSPTCSRACGADLTTART